MKIVYCIAGTYRSGGMERVLALKANWLVAHGCDVTIVTTDQRGRNPFFTHDSRITMVDLGVNYEENNGASFVNKLLKYPFKQALHRRRMAKVLDRINPDVVVSMFCNEAGFIPKLHKRSKKVLEIHFSRFKRLQYGRRGLYGIADRLRSKMDVKTAGSYDRFVVLTNEDREYWGDINNIEVIPNPMSFRPVEHAELYNKEALAIGRFSHQKSFDRMIEAWSLVVEKHPDWRLTIIGDGDLKSELEQQIEILGLTNNIELAEPITDVSRRYLNSSLYLMTSRYEGLPMVLIEAQSCGLPIVSFTCKCGPRDVVSDGVDGYLVEDGDIKAFAERVCTLIEDEHLRQRMGQSAVTASHRFDVNNVMPQWLALFNGLG